MHFFMGALCITDEYVVGCFCKSPFKWKSPAKETFPFKDRVIKSSYLTNIYP